MTLTQGQKSFNRAANCVEKVLRRPLAWNELEISLKAGHKKHEIMSSENHSLCLKDQSNTLSVRGGRQHGGRVPTKRILFFYRDL